MLSRRASNIAAGNELVGDIGVVTPVVEQNKSVRIEPAEEAVRKNQADATVRLQHTVQSIGPTEAASVYKQVAGYDAEARRASTIEAQNGYLTMKPAIAPVRDELAQNEPLRYDPYDSVPYNGQVFTEKDGQEYYWNFANRGTTEEGYKQLKELYGDQLVDHKIIQYREQDGTPAEGMILKWRVNPLVG